MNTLHYPASSGNNNCLNCINYIYTNTYSNDLWVLVLKVFVKAMNLRLAVISML